MIPALILFAVAFLGWVLHLYETREIIARVDGEPYLIRYFIWKRGPKDTHRIYLHQFVGSDHEKSLHDHPWSFRSLILWGGYYEVCDRSLLERLCSAGAMSASGWQENLTADPQTAQNQLIKWQGPLSRLWRPASWRHRVVLAGTSKGLIKCWTLVHTYGKVRSWGFWPNDKFCRHDKYDTLTGLCHE